MLSEFDRESLRSLLTDAIKLMCKNSLTYRTEFTIEGLLGITLDKTDVFLVNIAESIKSNDSEQHTQLAEQDSILVDDGEQYLEPQPPRPNNRAPLSVETTALCELPGSTSKRKMDNNDQMNYKRAKAMQITPLQQNNTADVLNLVENDSRERLPPKDIKIEINEDYEESDNVVKVELDEDGDIHRSDIPNISGNFDKLEESTETSEDFLAGLGRSLDFSGEFSAHPHLNESNSAQKKKKPVPKKQSGTVLMEIDEDINSVALDVFPIGQPMQTSEFFLEEIKSRVPVDCVATVVNSTFPTKTVRCLMMGLFTPKQLYSCTVTGKSGSRALPQHTVQLIINYVCTRFTDLTPITVKSIMAQKLRDHKRQSRKKRTPSPYRGLSCHAYKQ